ncbi:MAG: nitrile hydratase subunit beta [Pseudonocardiaceae bacterium]|nr:nitrile hydratase subunit beta [Pseudonocardiaceae bacterium]
METIADMGGTRGWGRAPVPVDEPVFAESWEGRAFALTLLSMGRVSGRNLDAFRHALERLPRDDYLADGYYGRWLNAAELMLTDSAILAPGAVNARARANRGEQTDQPAFPEPNKPDYQNTAAGQLRTVAEPPRFAVGDRVRAKDIHPEGHTRLCGYLRGHRGVIELIQPAAVLPDTNAHFLGENPQYVYAVGFDSHELWGPDAESFRLHVDLFESYLEADE